MSETYHPHQEQPNEPFHKEKREYIRNYTPEELGFISDEILVGDSDVRGSNRWKIEDFMKGTEQGIYQPGLAQNELTLAHPAEEVAKLPEAEAVLIETEINNVNRRVLDTLYEHYHANFEQAEVTERSEGGLTERRIVIPSDMSDFSFVETTFVTEVDTETATIPAVSSVEIIAGHPIFASKDGFSPVV